MRRPSGFLVLLVVLVACGGESVPLVGPSSATPSNSPEPSSSSPSGSSPSGSPGSPNASASPTGSPLVLPPGVPTSYAPDDEPGDVPAEALIPKSADVTSTTFPHFPEGEVGIVVTYARGIDPFAREQGLVVWRRFGRSPHWRATYGFRDPARAGVLGIQVQLGEATGDDLPEALTFESVGGTGDCGGWRVIQLGPAIETLVEPPDSCDTQVEFSSDPVGLVITEALFKAGDAHCCPSRYRVTQLEWNGNEFEVTSRETHPAT
jgi:hypothetical protein